ncbi:MAG TPA: cell division protein ZipA C-terminal FtsZ-binding domain-containing protein [Rudaea sp.]|nr:cell division protein ZipA C-terminal FtsZ-binding domain-containing protein [Rudaea sp.]
MTSLQLGLIIAAVALVIGVIIYNWWQERRLRARLDATFSSLGKGKPDARAPASERVEPTLNRLGDSDREPMLTRAASGGATSSARMPVESIDDAEAFELPVKVQARMDARDRSNEGEGVPIATEDIADAPVIITPPPTERVVHDDAHGPQPDPDIECIVALQPSRPVAAGALGAGLNARVGKRLRWFGRRSPGMPWQALRAETAGEFSDLIACLLLADRAGAASVPMLQAFAGLLAELAPTLPATFISPDVQAEAARAETLDRICVDLDVQIGLTILKSPPATIPGTRLRGVAEAAGFRLAGGRFEWVQEETGAVLYSLQNFRAEPFTAENLRSSATPGAVFLLDVPRVTDPARVFDQMKLAAKRMAQTLDAALVDDNRRPLDDAALAAIRVQIQKTAEGLKSMHIEPGSPRALALFGG